MLKSLQQMHEKLFQKEQFKKQQKQRAIKLATKLLIRLHVFQKNRLMKSYLQKKLIMKYRKKDKTGQTGDDGTKNVEIMVTLKF